MFKSKYIFRVNLLPLPLIIIITVLQHVQSTAINNNTQMKHPRTIICRLKKKKKKITKSLACVTGCAIMLSSGVSAAVCLLTVWDLKCFTFIDQKRPLSPQV